MENKPDFQGQGTYTTVTEIGKENSKLDAVVQSSHKCAAATTTTTSNMADTDFAQSAKNTINKETLNDESTFQKPEEISEVNLNAAQDLVDNSSSTEVANAEILPESLVEKVTGLNISVQEHKCKIPESKVVVNRESESLKSLLVYDEDSDDSESETEPQADDSDISSEENNTNKKTWRKNTDNASGTSDSESDSSASTLSLESDSNSDTDEDDDDSASVIDASDDGIRDDNEGGNKSGEKGAVKKKNSNIIDLEEFLPPLPDLSKLKINFEDADYMLIGKINAIITELITILTIHGTPALDIDTMLFIDGETSKVPIGPIYDVLGPVTDPIYCLRFNSENEITKLGLKKDMNVYAVPKSEEFTKFVFLQELLKIKGSDASWFHDQETPSDLAEFSDDEKEREAKRAKKTSKRKLDDDSMERHRRYERTMNHCNTLNTRVCRLMDAQRSLSKHIRPSAVTGLNPPVFSSSGVPIFDPSVPPPGFGFGQPTFYGIAAPPSPAVFSAPPAFSQPHPLGSNPVLTDPSTFGPWVFGNHYNNEPPSPQSLCFPPAPWRRQRDQQRLQRPNNPRSYQQNSDSYFSNNARNPWSGGAGPSSQPF